MPPTRSQLSAAYDKALTAGCDKLLDSDRDFFLILDFILQWENSNLSGYLYNQIPDFDLLRDTIDSMSRHGLGELATLLNEAVSLFTKYEEPNPPTTWGKVLDRYDPSNKLEDLNDRIIQLPDFGLSQ